jgi:hypothetical protein
VIGRFSVLRDYGVAETLYRSLKRGIRFLTLLRGGKKISRGDFEIPFCAPAL